MKNKAATTTTIARRRNEPSHIITRLKRNEEDKRKVSFVRVSCAYVRMKSESKRKPQQSDERERRELDRTEA